MTSIALFVPCYIDQFYPRVAIAALGVLERLGVDVAVPEGAVCCGQPPANAGFEHSAEPTLARFVETYADYDRVVVLSGSCAVHVRAHAGSLGAAGARVAERTTELCAFLHDEVGVDRVASLGAELPRRVSVHIGCHALRGMGLAKPSEIRAPAFDKVRALLGTVRGLTFAEATRPDECCGFGGTFAVAEPALSAKMGRDRLRDWSGAGAEAIVSTDVSCLMHLGGLAHRAGAALPMMHVAEVLSGPGARSRYPSSTSRTGATAPSTTRRPRRSSSPTRRARTGTTARSGGCARSATARRPSSRSGSSSAPPRRGSRSTRCRGSTNTSSASRRTRRGTG